LENRELSHFNKLNVNQGITRDALCKFNLNNLICSVELLNISVK